MPTNFAYKCKIMPILVLALRNCLNLFVEEIDRICRADF